MIKFFGFIFSSYFCKQKFKNLVKMDEEIGKWLLDISKYIITAYILSQMFGKDNDSWWSFIGAVLLAVLLFALGYYLIKKGKDKNKKGK